MKNCFILLVVGALFSCNLSKNQVPDGEYLIHGKLLNVPGGTVIEVYQGEGKVSSRVQVDTLVNGEFFLRDTVSLPRKIEIMSMDKGFPGMALDVWVASGKYIEISGEDKLLGLWQVKSDIPEQQEQDRYRACSREVQRELQTLSAAEYDWTKMLMIDNHGDEEFRKTAWSKIDSLRKLEDPLHKIVYKKELEYMKSAPISSIWMEKLAYYASFLQHENIMPYGDDVKELYARMPETERQTVIGMAITKYIYPDSTVGVGDEMVDGDLYDREGKLHHISEFRGMYILLDFWSGACGACVDAIPEVENVASECKDKVAVISISADPKTIWKKVLDENKMTGNQWNELLYGQTGLFARYRISAFPSFVLIAPDGKIQDTWCGYGKGTLFQKIRKNLAEVKD